MITYLIIGGASLIIIALFVITARQVKKEMKTGKSIDYSKDYRI